MTNPFIIKVPEGATELDLGPVLRPILWSLRNEIKSLEGSLRRSHAKTEEPDQVDKVMEQAINAYKYRQLLPRLTRHVLVAYLADNGWVDEDGNGWNFIRDYDVGKSFFDRRGPRIHLHDPREGLKLGVAHDAVRETRGYDDITLLDQLKKILTYENVLDRLANET